MRIKIRLFYNNEQSYFYLMTHIQKYSLSKKAIVRRKKWIYVEIF